MVLPQELRLPRFVITCTVTFSPLPKQSERWAIGQEIYPVVINQAEYTYPGIVLGEMEPQGPYWEHVRFTVEIDQKRMDLGDEILALVEKTFRERFQVWCSRLTIISFDRSEPIPKLSPAEFVEVLNDLSLEYDGSVKEISLPNDQGHVWVRKARKKTKKSC